MTTAPAPYTDRQTWMSDDQWRCAHLIAEVFGGFHHLPEFKPNGAGVQVRPYSYDLATFDFGHLTHLVILAHVRCIRVSVTSSGMKLAVHAFARDPNATASMSRHPTLSESIARYAPQEAKP